VFDSSEELTRLEPKFSRSERSLTRTSMSLGLLSAEGRTWAALVRVYISGAKLDSWKLTRSQMKEDFSFKGQPARKSKPHFCVANSWWRSSSALKGL